MGAWRRYRGLLSSPQIQERCRSLFTRSSDGPGVAAWRARMASEAGKAQYKARTICECIHARWRTGPQAIDRARIEKVRAVVLWYASPTTSCKDTVSQKHRQQKHIPNGLTPQLLASSGANAP